jgi:multisubunit Na+/H+ antiporter MnhG subunit
MNFHSAADARNVDKRCRDNKTYEKLWLIPLLFLRLAFTFLTITGIVRLFQYGAAWDFLAIGVFGVILGVGWLTIRSFKVYLGFRIGITVLVVAAAILAPMMMVNLGKYYYTQVYSKASRTSRMIDVIEIFHRDDQSIMLASTDEIHVDLLCNGTEVGTVVAQLNPVESLELLRSRMGRGTLLTLSSFPWLFISAEREFRADFNKEFYVVLPLDGYAIWQFCDNGLSAGFTQEIRQGLESRGWVFDFFVFTTERYL